MTHNSNSKNMKQKIKQTLMAIVGLLLSTSAFAHDFVVDGIYYYITDATAKTVAVTHRGSYGSEYSNEYTGSVTIPSSVTYSGTTYSITSIGNYAFSSCRDLTSITIPNSVDSIGNAPFMNCESLTEIKVISGNTKYDSRENCNAIIETATNTLIVGCKNTIIPNSVTSIGNYAFYGCTGLTEITIPNSVIYIAYYAFYGCSGLTKVTIGNSVTEIYDGVFMACTNLTEVNYNAENCTSMGSSSYPVFYGCTNLKTVNIGNSVKTIPSSAFKNCTSLTSVTIPNSVTSIDNYAFDNCNNLAELIIEDGKDTLSFGYNYYYSSSYTTGYGLFYDCPLEKIYLGRNLNYESSYRYGYSPFYNIKTLKEITIGNSVTSIGYYAFFECSGLTSVTISNSVSEIGNYAFCGCIGLTSAIIPNSVSSIGNYAFDGCNNLKLVINLSELTFSIGSYYYGCIAYYADRVINAPNGSIFDDFVFSKENNVNKLVAYLGNDSELILPTDFNGENYEIASGVFSGYSNLASVTIPNSVTSIDNYAFYGCSGLISVTIGSGISTIPSYAFSPKPIKTIWLTNTPPSGYENVAGTVNYAANDQYSSLSNVVVYPYLSSMFEVDGVKYVPVSPSERTCDAIDCAYKTTIDSVHIGKTVSYKGIAMNIENVNHYTFYKNNYLNKVTIDDEFSGLFGDFAFAECRNIDGIEIPNKVKSIGSNCFEGCEKLEYAIIGTSIPAINNNTFNRCSSLAEIEIPKNVESVGNFAFGGCKALEQVSIANRETVINLGSNDSNPLFVDCPLYSVYIGGNISYNTADTCGYSPFYNNKTLRAVTISDKETEISDNEFYGCANLKSVSIGDGVESIGKYAFSGCSSLESFAFGSSMKTIGEEAFSDCTAVTKIYSRATTPPVCGTQALDDINKWTCELYVPISTLSRYQAADQWKEFFYINEDAGVEDVEVDNNIIEVARYDINGYQLDEPAKGINIIKMSDGSTRKEIVK